MKRSNFYAITIILLLFAIMIQSTNEINRTKTSKYIGVYNDKTKILNPWRVILYIDGEKKYVGCFETEIKAAKQVNAACKKYRLPKKNPDLSSDDEIQEVRKQKISQYTCVYCDKAKAINPWVVKLYIDGKMKHFGCFDTEIKAAKQVNAMCKKYGLPKKNTDLSSEDEIPQKQKTSQFVGVFREKGTQSNHWRGSVSINGKRMYLGYFDTEIKAAKQVNAICQKYGKNKKNKDLSSDDEITEQRKHKKSQYFGVYYDGSKRVNPWRVNLDIESKIKYFGHFDTEIKAAKQVNAICKNYGLPKGNLNVSSDDEIQEQQKQKAAQKIDNEQIYIQEEKQKEEKIEDFHFQHRKRRKYKCEKRKRENDEEENQLDLSGNEEARDFNNTKEKENLVFDLMTQNILNKNQETTQEKFFTENMLKKSSTNTQFVTRY